MDNNFDENRSDSDIALPEENFTETPPEQIPAQQPEEPVPQPVQHTHPAGIQPNVYPNSGGGNFSGQPAQGYQDNGIPKQPVQSFPNNGYIPYAPGYIPDQNGAYPPPEMQKNKKLSKGCLWALIVTAIVLFAIIVILAAMIASQVKSMGKFKEKKHDIEFSIQTETAEHKVIQIPTSPKPVLDDELYQDKETGLLTTIGVAKAVLPSQVKIEIFDDVPYYPISSGSGIIISTDGYVLTNAHVVDGAKRMVVKFYDDTEEEAVLVGIDRKTDLAVVSVPRNDLTAAEIGTSSSLVIGEEVAIAGAGGGFENTVTYGHVTGLGREIDTNYISSSTINCIQTDAALNPGNSGGALVNMYGQVVGVAVALMNHDTYENIGFSIAIDDAVPIAEELIANGYVSSRSRVGISYMSVGDSTANAYGIMSGLCVLEVDKDSGAAKADIIPYDIITQIDGVRVFGKEEVAEALSGKVPGDIIRLTVFRRSITGKNDIFEVFIELSPDVSSISGYSEEISSEEFSGRDIIN